MANVGLKSFLYAPLTETESGATYTAPKKLAGAIESKVGLDLNSASVYSDDVLFIEDTSFNKGNITLGIDNNDDVIFAGLLGKTVVEKTFNKADSSTVTIKEITSSKNDEPIPVGFGYITGIQTATGRQYEVKFYKKVVFKQFETDSKTKGEKLEFTTPSVEGTISTLKDGSWKIEARLDDEATAIEYLKSLFVAA